MEFWNFLKKFDDIKDRKTNEFYEIVHKELMKDEYTEEKIKNMGEQYSQKSLDMEKFLKEKDGFNYIFGEYYNSDDEAYFFKRVLIEGSNRLEHWIVEQGEEFYNKVKNEGLLIVKNCFMQNNITIHDIFEERFIYGVFYATIERKRKARKVEIFSMMDDLCIEDVEKIKDYIKYLGYKKRLDGNLGK